MKIVCQQKYHALFVIFEKAAKFYCLLQIIGGAGGALRVNWKIVDGRKESNQNRRRIYYEVEWS